MRLPLVAFPRRCRGCSHSCCSRPRSRPRTARSCRRTPRTARRCRRSHRSGRSPCRGQHSPCTALHSCRSNGSRHTFRCRPWHTPHRSRSWGRSPPRSPRTGCSRAHDRTVCTVLFAVRADVLAVFAGAAALTVLAAVLAFPALGAELAAYAVPADIAVGAHICAVPADLSAFLADHRAVTARSAVMAELIHALVTAAAVRAEILRQSAQVRHLVQKSMHSSQIAMHSVQRVTQYLHVPHDSQ